MHTILFYDNISAFFMYHVFQCYISYTLFTTLLILLNIIVSLLLHVSESLYRV